MSAEQDTALFDEPWDDGPLLPEQDAAVGRKPTSRKHAKKVKRLQDMSFSTETPAQVIMRSEMARGVHQPERLASLLDSLGIPDAEDEVKALALSVIEHTPNQLSLGFRDWAAVQKLVEAGILAGYARAEEDLGPSLG
jgi:hypothetical protein